MEGLYTTILIDLLIVYIVLPFKSWLLGYEAEYRVIKYKHKPSIPLENINIVKPLCPDVLGDSLKIWYPNSWIKYLKLAITLWLISFPRKFIQSVLQ